jgi:DNA polymerase III subunit beta
MKAILARSELLAALNVVSKGTSSRTTLPILSGILMSASHDSLVMHATDLEVSVKASVTAAVEKSGETVVGGRLFADIVRSMPEAAVTIESSGPDAVTVSAGQSSFKVKTLAAEDFPKFPEMGDGQRITLPTRDLAGVVKQVSRAVSRDETRPVLTGMLVSIDGTRLKMVATDSYRLAVRETALPTSIDEALEVIVPGKALEEVARLASDAETLTFGVSENQVVFEFGSTVYISRRIEGTYPNYTQLLPGGYESRVVVGRAELAESVKRVSLLAQHNAPLRFTMTDSTLTLAATTPDVGEAVESLMVQTDGPDIEIAFNPGFLTDGIQSSESDTVAIEMTNPLKPAVLTDPSQEGFLYLLMPVRL